MLSKPIHNKFWAEPSPVAPATQDPLIPPRDRVVTRDIIERWAVQRADKVFLAFDDGGEDWTFSRFYELILQTAAGLQAAGVKQDDNVLVWLPNGRENVRIFFAANFIGAVYVPLNTAYRGSLLAHAINISNATLAIVDSSFVGFLDDVPLGKLNKVIVVGEEIEFRRLASHSYAEVLLPETGIVKAPERRIEPWDLQTVIFTSGTTGPSKGVLSSYLHLYTNAGPESWDCVTEDDRFLVQYPLFHVGGTAILFSMFARGASAVLVQRFDTRTFWNAVRDKNCTVAFLLGVMVNFLSKQPAHAAEKEHPLRMVFIVPLGNGVEDFGKRFGVDVYTIFNMTEVSTPIRSTANPVPPGTCGRKRPGVDVRIVDPNDCEVPVGEVGELIVRTDRPWGMNSGYINNPQATAEAWRNGWFHTGDLFRKDSEGNFFFVDRLKDAIRRRGENISSFEIEAELLSHPAIREAAAIGVRSEHTEEEVLACIALAPDANLDMIALIDYLKPRMAHFMVPRFFRILPELPKTPSAKVLKTELRKEGLTADTWDREKAGVSLKR